MRAVIAEMPARWLEERRNSDASQWDEMWDGVLHMAPMPTFDHQTFMRDLVFALHTNWGKPTGGEVCADVNLTTVKDAKNWTKNYRIPDAVLMSKDRLKFVKGPCVAGPPLVCVELYSPGDESYDKLPFYAQVGVPEVWIVHRDTKRVEIHVLHDAGYRPLDPQKDGWMRSTVVPVAMRGRGGRLELRFDGVDGVLRVPGVFSNP